MTASPAPSVASRPDHAADLLGYATIDPPVPVVGGSVGTWTLTYTAGAYGVDEGGTIKIARRNPSDWEIPQFDRPADSGYTTVSTTGQASLAVRFDRKGHHRPWKKCLVIDVYDGSLAPGDSVTVVFGDRTGGSPGIRAQSYQERDHQIRVFVDPTNANKAELLPEFPSLQIVPGEAVELKLVLPAQGVVGQRLPVHVRGQDHWGNPTLPWDDISLRWDGEPDTAHLDHGDIVLTAPGTGRVIAERAGIAYASNPIMVTAEQPALRRYWGDLHAQTDATVGTGTEEEYFTFAREVAQLDFTSHQGNDFQMTDADWQRLNDTVRDFHRDGSFVVFPGYEWSGNSLAGGDRNVFYLEEDMPIIRSSAWLVDKHQAADLSANVPVNRLFERLRAEVDTDKVLCASHVGGRYADIAQGFDEQLGPLVELVSCWGVFEWLLHDALEQGHIVGVMCNSDGHKGRPGAEGPGAGDFGIEGGLTCVLAEALTRESIFNALKQRRCYGTTGARMHLDFTADGQPMGSVIRAGGTSVRIAVSVAGCEPIERLTLHRGREIVHEVRPPAFDSLDRSPCIRIAWGGARIRGRGRRVTWDGTVRSEGCRIVKASPYSFDSPGDGITEMSERSVQFVSSTTGDVDGLDLMLDDATKGMLAFESSAGSWTVDLSALGQFPIHHPIDGVDMRIWAQRYPRVVDATSLEMTVNVPAPSDGRDAYFIKAVQCNGQTAWSSPIYVNPA